MSTKGTLYLSDISSMEIYEETSEPQSIFGQFTGFNIYIFLPIDSIEEWKIKGQHFVVKFKEGKSEIFPQESMFWGGAIIEVNKAHYDNEICIIIEGGTHVAEKILKKEFSWFDINRK